MALFPFPLHCLTGSRGSAALHFGEHRTEVCMYLFDQLGQTLLNGLFKLPVYPNPAPAPSQRQKAEGQMKFSAAFCLAQLAAHPLTVLSRTEAMLHCEGLVRPHNYYSL